MTLRKGDKGQQVLILQAALQQAGFRLDRYGADGLFGEETQNAVMQAQKHFLLDPTGEAGDDLLRALHISGLKKAGPAAARRVLGTPAKWLLAGITAGAIFFVVKNVRK